METKKDFKKITQKIKDEILSLGYGTIKLYIELWNKVDSITIDFNDISLFKEGTKILTFDSINCIDKQIQIYETIFEHKDQLSYYQLDWNDYFKAFAVDDECGRFIWRILTPDEARHLWFNGKGDLFQIYDDGTEGMIDNEEQLNTCISEGCDIGVSVN